jgi:hypothetical protein
MDLQEIHNVDQNSKEYIKGVYYFLKMVMYTSEWVHVLFI